MKRILRFQNSRLNQLLLSETNTLSCVVLCCDGKGVTVSQQFTSKAFFFSDNAQNKQTNKQTHRRETAGLIFQGMYVCLMTDCALALLFSNHVSSSTLFSSLLFSRFLHHFSCGAFVSCSPIASNQQHCKQILSTNKSLGREDTILSPYE